MIETGSVVRMIHKQGVLFSFIGVVESMRMIYADASERTDTPYCRIRFCRNGYHVTVPIPIDWLELIK